MGSGDLSDAAAAEAAMDEASARKRGDLDPPLTLTGRQRKTVRGHVLDVYGLLTTRSITKQPRLAQEIREAAEKLGAALAYLPEPSASAPADGAKAKPVEQTDATFDAADAGGRP